MPLVYTRTCLSKILYESKDYLVGYVDIDSYDEMFKKPCYFFKQTQEWDGDEFEGLIMFDTYNTCPNGLLNLFEEILEKNNG